MHSRPTGGRAASATFVLFTVALDALCFGIVIPVLPDLVREVSREPPSQASFYLGALFAVFSLTQFVCAPILGGLSDRFGRRPILLTSLSALGINSLMWVWVDDLRWLFVMRVFAGLFAANVPTASAYIADVTPPEQRARYFGLIGAMFGLGFILGPVFGGLLGTYWIRLPFLVSAGLIGCNVLYGVFVLPESLPPDRRRPFDWRRANPFASLLRLGFDPASLRLGFAWFATWFALGAQQTSFILSNQMRFGWNSFDNGLALALGGAAQALVQGLLVRRAIGRFGARETAMVGCLFAVAGYLVYSFAATPWAMVSGIPILALGALSGPPVQSLLSAAAGPQKQGEIQGALASLQGLAMVLGPLVMGSLFEAATRPHGPVHVPGAPFMLAACACLVAAIGLRRVSVPPVPGEAGAAEAGRA